MELRHRIQKANRSFAWLLALYHSQIFLSAVRAAMNFLEPKSTYLDRILIVLGKLALIFQLFDLARKSSELERLCVGIEQRFSDGLQSGVGDQDGLRQMLSVMRYHEDLDALGNGCYQLGTQRFMGFLITSVTCTAVILQFDFRIARAVTDLSVSRTT